MYSTVPGEARCSGTVPLMISRKLVESFLRSGMRRALASLLLAVFSLPLFAPLVIANPASELPACCLRDGKHHCAMGGPQSGGAAGLHFQAKCPFFPQNQFLPGTGQWLFCRPASSNRQIAFLAFRAAFADSQTFVQSVSNTALQRGPPAFLD
jgi:hypothetical protein